MATHFQVSDLTTDDYTLSRKSCVKLGTSGEIKFQTPLKVGLGNVTDVPFYEAYKRVKPETIINCLKSENKDREHGRNLRQRCRGNFNILTLEYDSKKSVPTDRMIVALSDMQYNNTDAITTPSWFDLITTKNSVNVKLYIELSKIFVEVASTRNHKPILGTIPQSIPPEKLDSVLKFYIDHDVTSFVVDSHGRTLISGSWIRALQRLLSEYDIEKESIMYTMNAFQGMVRKNETTIEAKDFIGFTAGFDVIGGKHTSKHFEKSDEETTNTVGRIFHRSTYNYEKKICTKEEKRFIDECSIREQNSEFDIIRQSISEGTMKNLLSSKNIAQETLNTIFSFKNKNHSMKIDDFI